jgi:hypothetical protein
VGGEVVTIEAWLDLLRDAWGVSRVGTNETPLLLKLPRYSVGENNLSSSLCRVDTILLRLLVSPVQVHKG